MAMGRCMTCDKLVFIRPVARQWESRACDWKPVPHARVVHPGCVLHLEAPEVGHTWWCSVHGPVKESELIVEPCDGDKRAIT